MCCLGGIIGAKRDIYVTFLADSLHWCVFLLLTNIIKILFELQIAHTANKKAWRQFCVIVLYLFHIFYCFIFTILAYHITHPSSCSMFESHLMASDDWVQNPLLYEELWVEMTCHFCTENLAISCNILASLLKKRVTLEIVAAQLPWTPDGCSPAGWSLLTVMFNFTCQRDWARWHPDIWSNMVSGCVCEDVSKERLTLNP